MKRKRILSTVTGILIFSINCGASPILSFSNGSPVVPFANSCHGWTFTPNQNLLVTQLGLFDGSTLIIDGFAMPHEIGLFKEADGTLLTSGLLSEGTENVMIGNFRYVDTPDVVLQAGERYTISYYSPRGHSMDSDNDWALINPSDLVVNPAVTLINSVWENGVGGLVMPSNPHSDGDVMLASNFDAIVIPEPSVISLFCLSGIGLYFIRKRSRN